MRPVAGLLSSFQDVPAMFAQARLARAVAGRGQGELVMDKLSRLSNSNWVREQEIIDVAD
jgi:hypothetical protein